MINTITTHLAIAKTHLADGWIIDFVEEAPGTRAMDIGPFPTRDEAFAWCDEATAVKLPHITEWSHRVDGSEVFYELTIQNKVPA
jgi:hypothetical protein